MMICMLSNRLVNYLEKNHYLKENKDIYVYGARLFISSTVGTVIVFFIGLLTHCLIEAILYEILISSSRCIMGGYHCKSYFSCICLYIAMFIIGMLYIDYIYIDIYLMAIIELIGIMITLVNCPVNYIHKTISSKKKMIFKKYSIIYIIIYITAMNIMFYFHMDYLNMIVYIFINIHLLTIGGRLDYELYQK